MKITKLFNYPQKKFLTQLLYKGIGISLPLAKLNELNTQGLLSLNNLI